MLMQNQNHWMIYLFLIHGAVHEPRIMNSKQVSVEEGSPSWIPGSVLPPGGLPVTPLSSPYIYVIGNT